MKRKPKLLSVKIELPLHALLPELSSAHRGMSISEVTRRLLWQEIERLGLGTRDGTRVLNGRRRFNT